MQAMMNIQVLDGYDIKKIVTNKMVKKYEPLIMQKKVNIKSIIELIVLFNNSLVTISFQSFFLFFYI